MWTSHPTQLSRDRGLKFTLELDSSPVPYADVLQRWQMDERFRDFFIHLLADSPFSAFRWETPAVTTTTAYQPFEFVLLDSPDLARDPEPDVFAEHFVGSMPQGIVEFTNLGGDAHLVVPCPNVLPLAYGHLGAFVRQAPESQIHALWQSVGKAMQRRLSDRPVWLSTAGGGVSWLHVRLDDWPKYYGYAPYR
ncbi:MAG: hypothetical protein F6K42_03975 [Leptolyngbya sp. SIO1D8]|nr:hypothetical protein [Leptolyngbya sp. SIO1D8]